MTAKLTLQIALLIGMGAAAFCSWMFAEVDSSGKTPIEQSATVKALMTAIGFWLVFAASGLLP